ncbi:MAG: glycosyltransferase family 4 protein [Flavobacteriales bacterium]|nr:glycosyltransferase family 4 protein [Flavobacteriales bacterium]
MHIAYLTPEYPHPKVSHSGGLGTSISNLAQELVKKGVEVTIVVYGQDKSEVFEQGGISFHKICSKPYKFAQWYFVRKQIQNYVNAVVKEKKIDLIEAADWTGITAFMRFDVPLVIRFHGSDTYFCQLENRKQKGKNRLFETLAVRGAQGYIAPTQYAGNESAKLFGIDPKKVKKIHYGLNLGQFENESLTDYSKGVVLYIGTIIRKKGVFELPSIFRKVREQVTNSKLVLIGGDSGDVQTGNSSTWDILKKEFSEDDISNVEYLGKIPYQTVQNYIRKANVCVFPTFAETLGMVTIESMALKRPVVNSNIGWAQELMIDGESGFLVYPANHDEYADKIVQLIKDENLSASIGKEAREYVERTFDIEKKVLENICFYKELIEK